MLATPLAQPSTRSVLVSATPFVREHLVRQRRPVTVLGRFPSALYLQLDQGVVIAVLTSDAVALPIGLALPTSSSQAPLDAEPCVIEVSTGAIRLGELSIIAASERSARLTPAGQPRPERMTECAALLAPLLARTELPPGAAHDLTRSRSAAAVRESVRALLGRGPGLTPSGDDVLCGILAGAALFGRDATVVRACILAQIAQRPGATTSLSRQLLERACDGDGIADVGMLGRALCGDSRIETERRTARLLTIGHSSGVALAYGLVAACELP